MIDITLLQIITVFVYMNIGFFIALKTKRNDLADVMWGIGFVLLALIGALQNSTTINIVIALMVAIWGIRLASHIGPRFFNKKEEDFRYKNWRREWGKRWVLISWLKVFILQAFFMILVSMSFLVSNRFDDGAWSLINIIGILIFAIGFLFETVGDWQLKKFIVNKDNKGKIMQQGLWRYTRHPNYFGEVVLWWGIWLTTINTPYFLLGIIGPLVISFLILKVSGIPMLEKKYEGRHDFEEYKQRTNAFFPWFPKKI